MVGTSRLYRGMFVVIAVVGVVMLTVMMLNDEPLDVATTLSDARGSAEPSPRGEEADDSLMHPVVQPKRMAGRLDVDAVETVRESPTTDETEETWVVAEALPKGFLVIDVIDRATRLPVVAAQVQVTVIGQDASEIELGVFKSETDSNGRARLEVLVGSLEVVAFTADGRFGRVTASNDWSTDDLLLPVELEGLQTIRGVVRDGRSLAPLAGVHIRNHVSSAIGDANVITDATGEFAFGLWKEGAASILHFTLPGYGSEHLTLLVNSVKGWTVLGQVPSLEWSDTEPFVEVELLPEKTIRGRVVRGDGLKVVGARVRAVGRVASSFAITTPDDTEALSGPDGSFALDGLRSDIDHVVLCETKEEGLALRFSSGGEASQDLGTIVLAGAARVSGTIVDRWDRPVGGAWVAARVEDITSIAGGQEQELPPTVLASLGKTTEADSLGRFMLEGIPAGEVLLTVHLGRSEVLRTTADLAPYATTDIGPLQLELEVELIEGVLVDASGGPVAQHLIQVFDYGRRHASIETAADGSFRVALTPGQLDEVTLVAFDAAGRPQAHWTERVTQIPLWLQLPEDGPGVGD